MKSVSHTANHKRKDSFEVKVLVLKRQQTVAIAKNGKI